MFLKNIKIGVRLGLGFGVILVIMVTTLFIITSSLTTVHENIALVEHESLPSERLADDMAFQTLKVLQLLLYASTTHNSAGFQQAEEVVGQFGLTLTTFKEMYAQRGDTATLQAVDELEIAFHKYYEHGKEMAFVYFTEGIEEGNELVVDFENAAKVLTTKMQELQDQEMERTRTSVADIITSTDSVKITMFLMNGLAIAFSVLIAFSLTRGITSSVKNIVEVATGIADGDLSRDIDIHQNDEIGDLATAFRNMKGTIAQVLQEMESLIRAVQDGKLDVRGNARAFTGGWRELVVGVNNVIDAFVAPIMMAAVTIDRVARGDIPENVPQEYQGDFNTITQNLNILITTMHDVTRLAEEMAAGDLTIEVEARSEQDALMQALNTMIAKLSEVVIQVQSAADNVAIGSREMRARSEEMSQGAAQQAAAAEEASSSMEEMAANIRQNAENARQTETIALQSAQYAEESSRVVAETVLAMQQIAKKISIIQEIADQTRMLSLNATIEAARAQEYGKAFSVVAAEVRHLSDITKRAAEEINELASSSVGVAENAGQMLTELVPNIHKTAELVQEISAASSEQSSGAEQINRAIQQLDQVTQQNSIMSENLASASAELAAQAEQLRSIMRFFRIDERFHITSDARPHPTEPVLPQPVSASGDREKRLPAQAVDDTREEADEGITASGRTIDLHIGGDDRDAEFERY